jgi:hypothetical protein
MVLLVANALNNPVVLPTVAVEPTTQIAVVASETPLPPTNTFEPPTQAEVLAAPTNTPELPTATLVPATDTLVPPTNILEPPTNTPEPPSSTPNIGPSPAPGDWLTVYFQWSNEVFFWGNYSSTRLRASQISFEALGGSGSFSGARWSQFSSYIYANGCMRPTLPR